VQIPECSFHAHVASYMNNWMWCCTSGWKVWTAHIRPSLSGLFSERRCRLQYQDTETNSYSQACTYACWSDGGQCHKFCTKPVVVYNIFTSTEEGGYVFGSVCLSVCLSVCPSDYSQTCERIL